MVMLTGLARVARTTGYPVVEVEGWEKRGHGEMSTIKSIMVHHTAGAANGDYPSLRVVRDGHGSLAGPLAQLGLGRSGTIYIVAAGLCYHAGAVGRDAWKNSHSIGIEAENTGTGQEWPAAQLDAYVKLCKALIDEFGFTSSAVIGHKEAAVPAGRKIDPNFSNPKITMAEFRAYVDQGSYGESVAPLKPSTGPSSGGSSSSGRSREWPTAQLVVDGKFWLITKRGYQRLLAPASVGDYRGPIDGDIGPRTIRAEQRWLTGLGYYKGLIDGDRGPMTIRALQSFLRDKGHYRGLIDAHFGPMSVRALQTYMNTQRQYY